MAGTSSKELFPQNVYIRSRSRVYADKLQSPLALVDGFPGVFELEVLLVCFIYEVARENVTSIVLSPVLHCLNKEWH